MRWPEWRTAYYNRIQGTITFTISTVYNFNCSSMLWLDDGSKWDIHRLTLKRIILLLSYLASMKEKRSVISFTCSLILQCWHFFSFSCKFVKHDLFYFTCWQKSLKILIYFKKEREKNDLTRCQYLISPNKLIMKWFF